MSQRGARGLVLPALLLLLLAVALRVPAPASAFREDDVLNPDHDREHDHDYDHDFDHDFDHDRDRDHDHDVDDEDEDEDEEDEEDDAMGRDGIKRIRLPKRFREGDWDADFEKLLHKQTPWGEHGDGKDSYEDFMKRFSSEGPVEDPDLDALDDWD